MIKDIEIKNFRLFKRIAVKGVQPINVIVGENGAGKTALMEAVFLTLNGSTQSATNIKSTRSGPQIFQGTVSAFVDSVYLELFHNFDYANSPRITLKGSGQEARSLIIEKGEDSARLNRGQKLSEATPSSPILFKYTSSAKKKYTSSVWSSDKGIEFRGTAESLPGFFYFSAFAAASAKESAELFSALPKDKRDSFVEEFSKTFGWVKNVLVKASGGNSALWAEVTIGSSNLEIPLSALSGGASRIASILIAMISHKATVVLVDEVENGVFYAKHELVAKLLLDFSRRFGCQLFMSTHSQEWLRAFVNATKGKVEDISLWRVERGEAGPEVRQFSGKTFESGIRHGAEIRKDQST
jgi:ABC-type molybdenum transport system ATPase subunit/photorepair protein PhrA